MSHLGPEIRSRRAVLAGAFGGITALAMGALGRPGRIEAANGDPVKVGQNNNGSALTTVTSSASGFKGKSTAAGGFGVIGQSTSSTGFGVNGINTATGGSPVGVRGSASGNGIGVLGIAARGVLGESGGPGGIGVVAKNTATSGTGNGLRALAFAPAADAVYAENSANGGAGHAVNAVSSTTTTAFVDNVSGLSNGVGVFARALNFGIEAHGRFGVFGDALPTAAVDAAGVRGAADNANHFGGSFANVNVSGFALKVEGGVRLAGAAGKATINSGADSVVVTPGAPFRTGTLVVATLQSDPGGSQTIARVDVGASTFTIRLTGNTSQSCMVGWIMVN